MGGIKNEARHYTVCIIFCDIKILDLEPWWESTLAIKPIVAQRILYDIRDGNSYRVRKLADGNCWMTENLRLEFDGNTTYDSSTTNLALGTTIKPSATQARTTAPTAAEIAEWAFANPPTTVQTNRWLSRGTQRKSEAATPSGDLTGENQLLGVYYNWYTATASSGNYDLAGEGETIAQSSICPAGWQLSRKFADGSYFNLLMNAYSFVTQQGSQSSEIIAAFHKIPFSMPYSGLIFSENGGTNWQGSVSAVWTAGASADVTKASSLFYNATSIYMTGGDYKTRGFSVRCANI